MEQSPNNETAPEQETIFSDLETLPGQYDRHIRHARNAMFAITIVEVILGYFDANRFGGDDFWIVYGEHLVIAFVFLVLGLLTKKKPYTAILTGIIIYGLIILYTAYLDPSNIIKGVFLKVLVFIFLLRGLGDARESQRNNKALRG